MLQNMGTYTKQTRHTRPGTLKAGETVIAINVCSHGESGNLKYNCNTTPSNSLIFGMQHQFTYHGRRPTKQPLSKSCVVANAC